MNEVATRSNTDVAVPESNPYASYGDSGTGIVGDLLKFSKGDWLAGQDERSVPEGTQIVVNMETVKTGWVRWQDAKPTDEEMVSIASGMSPPRRSDLGDNDQDLWETDKDGKPQDPWQNTSQFIAKSTDGEDEYTFSTSSAGGRNAIKALCATYGKVGLRQYPGKHPVVELVSSSYKHKEYGKIFTPEFKVVGWLSDAELMGGTEGADAGSEEDPKPRASKKARF